MGGSEVVRRKVHALLLCCTRAYKETGSVGMICIWNFTVGKKKKKKPIKCTPEVAEAKIYIFFFSLALYFSIKRKE